MQLCVNALKMYMKNVGRARSALALLTAHRPQLIEHDNPSYRKILVRAPRE